MAEKKPTPAGDPEAAKYGKDSGSFMADDGKTRVEVTYSQDGRWRRETYRYSNGNWGTKYYDTSAHKKGTVPTPYLTVDSRGNRRDASGNVTGPTGGRAAKSPQDAQRLEDQAWWENLVAEERANQATMKAEYEKLLAPYRAIGEEGQRMLAQYRKDPGAYVRGQYGFAEGEKAGMGAIEAAASSKGDFLGDGSRKRLQKFSIDYLGAKKGEALGEIMTLLGVGQAATGQNVSANLTTGGMGLQATGMQGNAFQLGAGAGYDAINQAAQQRYLEDAQRRQIIADRQTAVINSGGNVVSAVPSLFAPIPKTA